jgi:hypothetical protein
LLPKNHQLTHAKKSFMKMKITLCTLFFLAALSFAVNGQNTFPSTGAAGIGTTAPNASSLLEIKSTTKGVLIPRMTLTQRNAIASPTTGLLIFQTNSTPGFYYYNGTAWTAVTPKAKGWSLTGNAGTDSSINFLGTTDAHPLVFRVNNKSAGYIDYSSANNTSFGYQGLLVNTGTLNTAYGAYSLNANTTGHNNTATGYEALYHNTTGSDNTANGVYALTSNVTGDVNTANGYRSLYFNTTGEQNTATGYAALENNNGNYNSAHGTAALNNNIGGFYNTANGAYSLLLNTSGSGNTANGYSALHDNTGGFSNVAVGISSLYKSTNASNLVAVGDSALYNQLDVVTGGEFPVYGDNTGVGSKALFGNTHGQRNTAVGSNALYNTQGSGGQASYNTGIGFQSLISNVFGGENTALGASADVNDDSRFNATAVGYGAIATADNQVMLGNSNVTAIWGAGSIFIASDGRFKKNIKENVPGLAFINQLKPVTYNYDIHELNNLVTPITASATKSDNSDMQKKNEAAITTKEKIVYTGFVAQDVEAAAKKINYDFSGVHKPQNDKDPYGLSYSDFVVPLVKAVQELSKINDDKDAKIDAQDKKIDDLQKQINELKAMIVASQSSAAISSVSLQQNIPNPFNHTTTINYTLPQTYSTAKIIVTDNGGKTLKELSLPAGRQGINAKGKGSLNIDASILASGAYQYSLIVDGKLIDTKQMEHIR